MSQFADTSEVVLGHVAESTLGTTPTNPVFLKTRFTGETLAYAIDNITSNEIRPDAGVSDLIQVGAGVTGEVAFEWSYDANFQALLADCFRGSWSANVLKRGVLKNSRSFEKKLELGTTDSYLRFTGCRMGGLNGQVQAKQVMTGSAPLMGLASTRGEAILSGATYTDASLGSVMAAPDVAAITIGGVGGTVYVTQLSWQMSHNLRMQNAVGNLAAVGIGYGQTTITGSIEAYFDGISGDLYDLAVAGTESSLSFDVTDAEGNSYTIEFPRIKFNNPRANAGGNNQDVLAQLDFQALIDSGESTDFKITRTPASP
jgi:hypothetical protein